MLAKPDGRGGATIAGDPEHPANFGRLCSKGSALGETLGLERRLLHPMVRDADGDAERDQIGTTHSTRSPTASRASSQSMVPTPSPSISPVNC